MLKYFHEYVMPLYHLGMQMSERGVRIDLPRLERVRRVLTYLVERRKRAFERETMRPMPVMVQFRYKKAVEYRLQGVNPASPAQLSNLLYQIYKLPVQINEKTNTVTTNEEAIVKLASKYGKRFPTLNMLLSIREVSKMKSTYADVVLSKDGRLVTTYLISGTETGRFSSKKNDEDEGLNMQNLPPWFRNLIIADDDKVLIEWDLSQAEARIVAYVAGEESMIGVFNDPNRNIHKFNASKIFHIPEDKIEKDNRRTAPYGMAKRVTHGFDYGLGARHAAQITKTTIAEMERMRKSYFAAFPRIPEWHSYVENIANTTRVLVTPFGRRRRFLGRPSKRTEDGKIVPDQDLVRKMIAYVPQSTCTEYLKRGMLRMQPNLPDSAEILMDNHDGGLLQCDAEDVERCKELIISSTCLPLPIMDIRGNTRQLTIPVEIKTGKSWGEMK